jgi:hypothetical protein
MSSSNALTPPCPRQASTARSPRVLLDVWSTQITTSSSNALTPPCPRHSLTAWVLRSSRSSEAPSAQPAKLAAASATVARTAGCRIRMRPI